MQIKCNIYNMYMQIYQDMPKSDDSQGQEMFYHPLLTSKPATITTQCNIFVTLPGRVFVSFLVVLFVSPVENLLPSLIPEKFLKVFENLKIQLP